MTREATRKKSEEEQLTPTEAKLSRQTLVVNKAFVPVQTTTVRHAFELLCQERAKVVSEEYFTFTLDEWIVESTIRFREGLASDEDMIRGVTALFLIPKVITLTDYELIPRRIMRFRRRDVFARDHYTCQYCGEALAPEKLTLDHILPRSRGGKTVWENCVASCKPCNTYKADRTPEEANMRLLNGLPKKPNPNYHFIKRIENDKTWNKFI